MKSKERALRSNDCVAKLHKTIQTNIFRNKVNFLMRIEDQKATLNLKNDRDWREKYEWCHVLEKENLTGNCSFGRFTKVITKV